MNVTDYCLMAREYSIWNAVIASLQFWMADLDPATLGMATEEVYSTFFYSTSTHTLCQQSDEILFGHFMIALNAAFGMATEEVCSTFFYSTSTHTLCQQSDEILFGHFMIALNAAFEQQLSLAD